MVEVYNDYLFDSALRCGNVYFDRQLKYVFVEGQMPASYALERNYFTKNPQMNYPSVARYAQVIGKTQMRLFVRGCRLWHSESRPIRLQGTCTAKS